jgi:hypothetical protein
LQWLDKEFQRALQEKNLNVISTMLKEMHLLYKEYASNSQEYPESATVFA